jgi:tetratricopeptide (TPR) repeat protein
MSEQKFDEGIVLLHSQKFEEAIDFFKKFVEADPSDGDAWRKLAVSYAGAGKLEEALKSAEEAEKLSPLDPEILDLMGSIHSLLNHDEEVLRYADKSIQANPENTRPWINKFLILHSLGRIEDAKKCYLQGVKMAPAIRDPEFWNDLVVDLHGDKDPEKTIAFLDLLIELDPEEISYKFNKLRPLERLERFEDVLQLANEIIEAVPELSPAWQVKGICLLSLEKYEEALRCFERTIRLDPQNSEAMVLKERTLKFLAGDLADEQKQLELLLGGGGDETSE